MPAPSLQLRCAARTLDLTSPQVMGVLNVTPDSFSDGGRYAHREAAVEHGLRMMSEGAALIDVGGESTRPGRAPVSVAEELERVVPVIDAPCSSAAVVDVGGHEQARGDGAQRPPPAPASSTMYARCARPVRWRRRAESGCAVCLMHMQGEPRTMQAGPRYADVVAEVRAFLGSAWRPAAPPASPPSGS